MNPKTKNILIGAFVFIIAVSGLVFFLGKEENEENLSSVGVANDGSVTNSLSGDSVIGDEFLVTLLNLRTLDLDGSLFEDSTFKNLEDSTINITQPGNEGRNNPFAPIGSEFKTTPSVSDDFIFNQSIFSDLSDE